jgi:HK97 family phage prohead protease
VTDRVLAVLAGVAVSFDPAGCSVPSRVDGRSQHEVFQPGAFTASIRAGGTLLRLNHDQPVRGRFQSITEDAGVLTFRFAVFDHVLGQQVVADIRRGRIRHCSIAFRATMSRYGGPMGTTLVIEQADLTEISVLESPRAPAWYHTHVRVVES